MIGRNAPTHQPEIKKGTHCHCEGGERTLKERRQTTTRFSHRQLSFNRRTLPPPPPPQPDDHCRNHCHSGGQGACSSSAPTFIPLSLPSPSIPTAFGGAPSLSSFPVNSDYVWRLLLVAQTTVLFLLPNRSTKNAIRPRTTPLRNLTLVATVL